MIFKIIKEYIRRILRNYKIYLVSILGMSIAITAIFHIYHFVYKEFNVNAFHKNKSEIYRVVKKRLNSNLEFSNIATPLGIDLKEKFPQIKNYTRIRSNNEVKLEVNNKVEKAEIAFIEESFFEIFNFSLTQGTVTDFEKTVNGMIISEKAANKHFKSQSPIGKRISISEEYDKTKTDYQVVGVLKDIPNLSTIKGDYFIHINNYQKKASNDNKWITFGGANLYLQIPNLTDRANFSKEIEDLLFHHQSLAYKAMMGQELTEKYLEIYLQKLDEVYLNSTNIINQKNKGDYTFLKIIILVSVLTLLLAIFNFILMNLGLNLNRVKEFNLRRYLGASKKIVFFQLVLESQINAVICFLVALITFPILQNKIGSIFGFDYQLSVRNDFTLIISFLVLILFVGFITGALEYLFSYKSIFSDKNTLKNNNHWLAKKIMVGFQLFLCISLIICISLINKQIKYIQQKDLGYNTENTVNITTRNHKDLKNILDTKSYVKMTSYSDDLFSSSLSLAPLTNSSTNDKIEVILTYGDYNFIDIHEMKLVYGSNFTKVNPTEKSNSKSEFTEILVNEEFVKKAGLTDAIDKTYTLENKKYIIKGVFKNVYNLPLYFQIQPMAIVDKGYDGYYYGKLIISYTKGSKKRLEQFLKYFYVSKGFDTVFLDTLTSNFNHNDVYKKEILLKRILEIFTLIILFISLLGIVAISLFITESRTKEIGIRKVNGASIKEILFMLNKDFVKWVGISFVIACPISYYLMSSWLENFAYKTALSWWVFALAGVFTLVITLITVSLQTYKAATQNPVKSLRDE